MNACCPGTCPVPSSILRLFVITFVSKCSSHFQSSPADQSMFNSIPTPARPNLLQKRPRSVAPLPRPTMIPRSQPRNAHLRRKLLLPAISMSTPMEKELILTLLLPRNVLHERRRMPLLRMPIPRMEGRMERQMERLRALSRLLQRRQSVPLPRAKVPRPTIHPPPTTSPVRLPTSRLLLPRVTERRWI